MSDFDPTTNRVPFGLLSEDEQTALMHWPNGWEFYSFRKGKWGFLEQAAWIEDFVYRGKPEPVVTSVWYPIGHWDTLTAHASRKEAEDYCQGVTIAVLRIDTCNGVSTAHLESIGGDK